MKILNFTNRKLFASITTTLIVGVGTLAFPVSHASAASLSDCNKVGDPAACKQAFKECDKKPNPDLCKEIYLNAATQLATEKAPPRSDCQNVLNKPDCFKDYDACGNKNDKDTVNCKQKVIAKYQNVGAPVADQPAIRNGKTCGGSDYNYYTPSIDIGCRGQGNPIADALFGIIRFLSAGVGLVIIGSIVVGGMQYTGSRGDPQATAMAVNRIRSSLFALILFIFAYAILNYIIPAGFLK